MKLSKLEEGNTLAIQVSKKGYRYYYKQSIATGRKKRISKKMAWKIFGQN